MLFFSDVKQYIPVKLCTSAGSVHLFQIYGQLSSDQIVLEKNCLWDMIRINWKEVFVTLNGTIRLCQDQLKYCSEINTS